MIDINELREKITTKGLDVVADADILVALDRLEAAEKERDNANAAAVSIALEAERLQCENYALRARIEAMERQEPVAWMLNCPTLGGDTGWILSWTQSGAGQCNRLSGEENERKLYLAPGAKGE